jgi:hypothetical protein
MKKGKNRIKGVICLKIVLILPIFKNNINIAMI